MLALLKEKRLRRGAGGGPGKGTDWFTGSDEQNEGRNRLTSGGFLTRLHINPPASEKMAYHIRGRCGV